MTCDNCADGWIDTTTAANSVYPCPNCKPAEYDFYQHGALTQGHLAGRSKDKDNLTKARERYEVPTIAELYSPK